MKDIDYELDNGLAVLTLNRPEKLNAFDVDLARQLRDTVQVVSGEPTVRAVLLRAEGAFFSAGGDLRFFSTTLASGHDAAQQTLSELVDHVHAVIQSLSNLPVPVVAAVQGGAAGFGLSLLSACDFVVAAQNSHFRSAYITLGASPDGGATWLLPRLLGQRAARRLLMLGETWNADTALRMGLIDLVAEANDVQATATALATRLAAGPSQAYGRIKHLLSVSTQNSLPEQLAAEKQGFLHSAATADFQAGLQAFLARQPPQFHGF